MNNKQSYPHIKSWEILAKALVELFYPLVEATLVDASTGPDYTRPVVSTLKGGRKVKTTDIAIRDENGTVIMLLCLRFDISIFEALQKQISTLLAPEEHTSPLDSWQTQLDHTVQNYLKKHQLTLAALSRSHKREIVLELYQKGLFDYKDAANFIADILDTSRATIYNYLNWAATVRRVNIHQVDAFTDKRFGGNPAGVVLDAETLSDELMRKITREMNLSETAFVLPSSIADLRLRYFTPSGDEVKFCGHSTVGALYMLAREGRRNIEEPGTYSLSVETLCGVIEAHIIVKADDTVAVGYEAPKIVMQQAPCTPRALCDALGIDPHILIPKVDLGLEQTNRSLFVPINNLKALGEVACDMRKVIEFSRQHDLVAICFVTPECFEADNDVHCRVFAPSVGIPEDPFTGSVQGGLAAYLHQQGLITGMTIRVEQGHFMKRPGTVEIALSHKKGHYRALIEAQAVHFFSTQVDLI